MHIVKPIEFSQYITINHNNKSRCFQRVWPLQDPPCSCRSLPRGATRCLQLVCCIRRWSEPYGCDKKPYLTTSYPSYPKSKERAQVKNWFQVCALGARSKPEIHTLFFKGLMDDHPRNHDEPMMNLLTMPRYPATPVMETSLRLANVTPRKVLAWELQWLLTQYSTVYPCNSMYIKICSQHIAIFIFIIFKRIANHQPKRTSQANMSSIKNCKQKTG